MIKSLIAAAAAVCLVSAANAEILEVGYSFDDGSSVFASLYGSVTSANIFEVSGSRFFQQGSRFQYQGTTSIRGIYGGNSEIALDKSFVNFNAQFTYSSSLQSSVLLSVGDAIAPGYPPTAAYSNTKLVPLDMSKLTVTLLRDAKLDFTYVDPNYGSTTTGTMTGWITPDGSRFEVGGLSMIDGAAPPTGLMTSGNYGLSPSIMLDKSQINVSFYSQANHLRGDFLDMNLGGTYADIEYPDGLFATSFSSAGFPIWGNLLTNNLTLQLEGANAAVPEPTNWALMVLGFGVLGGTMRRRNVTTSAA